ncbi:MAG: CBS domain-containing protein [Dehalococcoidia bacterium]|nr:CBS domain-containing protein [Dehalococcoidia bacterium]
MYGYVGSVLGEKGREVYSTSPAATVREAVHEMNERGVGALLVMEGDTIVGIFTERDVLRRVVGPGRHAAVTRVGEVMTPDPTTVPSSMHVEEAMRLMTEHRFRHLPIVDEGRLAGLVSIGDLTRLVSTYQQEHIQRMSEYIIGGEAVILRQ